MERYETAVDIITRYYPKDRFPQKALYALEELLETWSATQSPGHQSQK